MKWKTIPKFPNYEVSNMGEVKRKRRIVSHPKLGQRELCERLLSPAENEDGYPRVRIARKLVFVHRLVLEAFKGDCPAGMSAIHKNGIRTDNRLANLAWGKAGSVKRKIAVNQVAGPWKYIFGLKEAA